MPLCPTIQEELIVASHERLCLSCWYGALIVEGWLTKCHPHLFVWTNCFAMECHFLNVSLQLGIRDSSITPIF